MLRLQKIHEVDCHMFVVKADASLLFDEVLLQIYRCATFHDFNFLFGCTLGRATPHSE